MKELAFLKGELANLPENRAEGVFYHVQDTKTIYLDDMVLEDSEAIKQAIETIIIDNELVTAQALTDLKDTKADISALTDYALVSDVPTKVSDLENDENYFIATTDGDGSKFLSDDGTYKVVDMSLYIVSDTLPTTNINSNKIYLIPSKVIGEGNAYTEYMYNNGMWEEIGSFKADIDLTNYAKIEDIPSKISELENDLNFFVPTVDGDGTKYLSDDGTYKELFIPEVSTNVFDISSLIGASDGVLSYQLYNSDGNSIEGDAVSQFIKGSCLTTTLDKDYFYLSYNGVYGNTILYVTDEFSSMFDKLEVYYNDSLIADSFNNNFKIVITDLGYVVGIVYNHTLYLISDSAQRMLLNDSTSSVVYTNAFKTTSYYGQIFEGDVISDDIAYAIALKCNHLGGTFQSPFILTIEAKHCTIVASQTLSSSINGYPDILLNLTDGLHYYNVQIIHNGSSYIVGLIEKTDYLTEHQDISHLATQEALDNIDAKYADKELVTAAALTKLNENKADKTEILTYSITKINESLEENVLEAYALTNSNGDEVGDRINIYKDSALQSAVLDGQELVLTYILSDGSTSIIRADISKFLHEDEFGKGLEITNNIVNVKIADDSERFLTLDENGIKLDGVQTAIDTVKEELLGDYSEIEEEYQLNTLASINQTILENEQAIAAALTDLEETKAEKSDVAASLESMSSVVDSKLDISVYETNMATLNTTLDSKVNTSDYTAKVSTLETSISTKQDKLTAGTNIEITDNVVSCTIDTELYITVSELPTEDIKTNKVYILLNSEGGEQNIHEEYMYINGAWEKVGENQDNFVSKEEFQELYDGVIEGEEVTAAALTDLNENKANRTEVSALEEVVITNNATITESLDTKVDTSALTNYSLTSHTHNLSELTNDANFITIDDVDLTPYALQEDLTSLETKVSNNELVTAAALTDLNERLDDKQDTLYAGENISITNGEITCTLEVPTKTSDLTNDSGFLTAQDTTISSMQTTIETLQQTIATLQQEIIDIKAELNKTLIVE